MAYVKALAVAIVLAVATGIVWRFIRILPFADFFNFLIGAAVGLGIGEGISLATNRKAGIGLSVIAGAAVVASYLISVFIFGGQTIYIYDIIAVIIGIFVSISRLR